MKHLEAYASQTRLQNSEGFALRPSCFLFAIFLLSHCGNQEGTNPSGDQSDKTSQKKSKLNLEVEKSRIKKNLSHSVPRSDHTEQQVTESKPSSRSKPEDRSRPLAVGEGSTRKCRLEGKAKMLWPSAGPTSVISMGDGFIAAGYVHDDQEELVFLSRFSSRAPAQTIAKIRLSNPSKIRRMTPPGLGDLDEHAVILAVTDNQGAVFAQRIEIGKSVKTGELTQIGDGADIRFAPAVSTLNGFPLVAWTIGTTPMQSRIAKLLKNGRPTEVRTIAPPSMGAAAGVFISGHSMPFLLAIDARDGFSPLLEIPIKADGTPGKTKVKVPVGMVTTPVELAAAHGPMGTFAAYTGIGKGATSAIGLVQLDPEAGSPLPMIPGTAYGRLHVAATAGPHALIFAADAPQTTGKDPDHEIKIFLIDSQGLGPESVVRGPDGTASEVALASNQEGLIAVTYCSQMAIFATLLICPAEVSR